MTTPLVIDNAAARQLWLECQGFAPRTASTRAGARPVLDAATDVVGALGMVQLDPIRTVARAHEHILWSRCARARPPTFERLIETRRVFEHFSHDAVILPMSLWPFWRRQRARRARTLERGSWGQALPSSAERRKLLAHIDREGACCSRDFDRTGPRPGAWSKPPHKVALDWLWLSGELAVSHRNGFVKHYDLTERVIPASLRDDVRSDAEQIDHLCREALQRLGIASVGELQRFWDAVTADEVRAWITAHARELVDVVVVAADGRRSAAVAPVDIESRLQAPLDTASRVRIVNPFDPVVRERARLERLFGFDFRIEIYVPPAKRRYGYYVFPLLEGNRFIGRADIRADRETGRLDAPAVWLEDGVRFGSGRQARLGAELTRFARLADVVHTGGLPEPRAARD